MSRVFGVAAKRDSRFAAKVAADQETQTSKATAVAGQPMRIREMLQIEEFFKAKGWRVEKIRFTADVGVDVNWNAALSDSVIRIGGYAEIARLNDVCDPEPPPSFSGQTIEFDETVLVLGHFEHQAVTEWPAVAGGAKPTRSVTRASVGFEQAVYSQTPKKT